MISKAAVTSLSVLVVASIAGWSTFAYSQGSGSSRVDPPRATRPQTPDEFYSSFWSFLAKKDAAYNTWKVINRVKADDGIENPHSNISKTYVNKIAADDAANLPISSILVREDYDDNRKRQSVSVLYRIKDYDKEHGNWYWIKYQENGSVARDSDDKVIAGKVASCVACHSKANGNDFVFSNDAIKSESDSKRGDKPDETVKPKE
ncbi:MAG: hypothetical protein JWP89_434 [Schlesneria sp.]|nr:hypothetical protein [Schlesneria sp.]